jgi:hypothetical protein
VVAAGTGVAGATVGGSAVRVGVAVAVAGMGVPVATGTAVAAATVVAVAGTPTLVGTVVGLMAVVGVATTTVGEAVLVGTTVAGRGDGVTGTIAGVRVGVAVGSLLPQAHKTNTSGKSTSTAAIWRVDLTACLGMNNSPQCWIHFIGKYSTHPSRLQANFVLSNTGLQSSWATSRTMA